MLHTNLLNFIARETNLLSVSLWLSRESKRERREMKKVREKLCEVEEKRRERERVRIKRTLVTKR
jgi:hypothetical protein